MNAFEKDIEAWERRHAEENQKRHPWERLDRFGRLESLWGLDRNNPGATCGFIIFASDHLHCRMLGCNGASPGEHPWVPYPIYVDFHNRLAGHLTVQATT